MDFNVKDYLTTYVAPAYAGSMNVELLQKIKQAILEEPRRIDMTSWALHPLSVENPPACNTVACIAGWAVALTNNLRGKALSGFEDGIEYTAEKYLDLPYPFSRRLFYMSRWPRTFQERLIYLSPRTPEYARVVADRIDHFIATEGRE